MIQFDEYIVQMSGWKPPGSKSCWIFVLVKVCNTRNSEGKKNSITFQPAQAESPNRWMVGRGYFRAADSGELQWGGGVFEVTGEGGSSN